ncbi:hypothetical protein CLV98_102263 [Dyadobacter jejuensis]|uniref:Uncharacterized protein n=1 Tax=Dyadobacter jejuensis TaxID=1082580 RepID=A0A316ARH4_9BACT|nr:hypothetical protein [Dyadobacter jejuensis]PWJ59430.1 hypothetical protein CLV98_102263 [Dyadobacter jejuensis]
MTDITNSYPLHYGGISLSFRKVALEAASASRGNPQHEKQT